MSRIMGVALLFFFGLVALSPVHAGVLSSAPGTSSTFCTAGQYLDVDSDTCMSCPAGHFTPHDSHQLTDCLACPPGSSASGGSSTCDDCPPGTYSASGAETCSFCSAGYYSGPSWTKCEPCPAGTYSNDVAGECTSCMPGRFSEFPKSDTCLPCSAGRFASRFGSKGCEACPVGTYQSSFLSSSCLSCPAGTYGEVEGLLTAECTGLAPPGYYTNEGTEVPVHQCPPGRFAAISGSSDSQCEGPCEPGHYCPNYGHTSPTPVTVCKAGRYGLAGQTDADCTGPCDAGYFCTEGSPSATQFECAAGLATKPERYYCPKGSVARSTVFSGYYTVPEDGPRATTREAQMQCPKGSYCLNGIRTECAAGRYGSQVGETRSTCVGVCDAGFFCPPGSSSPRQQECGAGKTHPAAWYCPSGVEDPIAVATGFYSMPESAPAGRRTSIGECDERYSCANGVRRLNLEWTDSACGPDGTHELHIDENTASSSSVGVLTVINNVAGTPAVTFTVTSQVATAPSCSVSPSFSFSGGSLISGASYDAETCPEFKLNVVASAGGRSGPVCSLSVHIDNVNEAPVLPDGRVVKVLETARIGEFVGAPVTASDPDLNQDQTYTILSGNTGDVFSISPCDGQILVDNPPVGSSDYSLQIRVTDEAGASDTTTVTVQVELTNRDPVFDRTEWGFTIPENPSAGAAVSSTHSPTGAVTASDEDPSDTLVYSLDVNDQDAFAIHPDTAVLTILRPELFNYERPADQPAPPVVRVSDGKAETFLTVPVVVTDANDAPTVSGNPAEVYENVGVGTNVGLPLSSSDEDGDSVLYSISGGTGAGVFSVVSSTGQIQTAAPIDFETTPSFTLEVVATDSRGLAGPPATIDITVRNVNEGPTISPGSYSIQETPPLVGGFTFTPVQLDPPLATSDPDGDELFISITGGDSDMFYVDVDTMSLVLSSPTDYETKTSYSVTITVQDNGSPALADTATYVITITNFNEQPVLAEGQHFTVTENSNAGTVIGTLVASDPDGEGALAFAVPASSPFSVTGNQLKVKNKAAMDFEDVPDSKFTVLVTVTDSEGAESTGSVDVYIEDVNEPPEILAQTRSINRGAAPLTPIGKPLVCTDQDLVDDVLECAIVDISGNVQYSWPPGFVLDNTECQLYINYTDSVPGTHRFYVGAQDHGGLTTWAQMTVTIVDANLPPVTDDVYASISEFVAANQLVATVAASDPNGDTLTFLVDYTDPPTALDFFSVDSATGEIRTVKAGGAGGVNYEDLVEYRIILSVQDNGAGRLASKSRVYISVTDVPEPPVAEDLRRQVPEDQSVGAVIGTVVAFDPDLNQTLSYSLAATATVPSGEPHPFSIDDTGAVTLNQPLDHETVDEYEITVTVTDPDDLTATSTLYVSVANVNEPPTAESLVIPAEDVPEDVAPDTIIGTITADDEDVSDRFSLQFIILSGNTGNAFRIDGNNVITNTALDFEDVESYELAVRVSDGELFEDITVSIAVEDINDMTFESFSSLEHLSTGLETVVITGSNFGSVHESRPSPLSVSFVNSIGVTYNPTCSITDLNTEISCTMPVGSGHSLVWTITVGPWQLTPPITTTYVAPSLIDVSGDQDMNTAGGAVVTLVGKNLGPTLDAVVVSYRSVNPLAEAPATYIAADCVMQAPHVLLKCKSVPGVGFALEWRVEVADQLSAPWSVLGTYAAPVIDAVEPAVELLNTRGGESVKLTGSNFGPSGTPVTVTYGPSGGEYLASCLHAESHTILSCTTAAGFGKDHVWIVSVAGLTSEASTHTTSYRPPVVVAVDGGQELFTKGGQELLISGDQFGPVGTVADPHAVYGPPPGAPGPEDGGALAGTLAYSAAAGSCRVVAAHTKMSCITSQGTGYGHAIRVTVGQQESNVYDAQISYHVPVVTEYEDAGARDADTRGAQRIVLVGDYFGPSGTPITRVTYGKFDEGDRFEADSCELLEAHERIVCYTAEGAGEGLIWTVLIDRQASQFQTTNYMPPSIDSFSGDGVSLGSTDGERTVVIHGANFAFTEFLQAVTYGETGVEYRAKDCTVLTHSSIQCTTVPGTGTCRWFVTVAGQRSELSVATTSYALPHAVEITPSSGSPIGEYLATISGFDFAPLDSQSSVWVAMETGWTESTPSSELGSLASGTGVDTKWRLIEPLSVDLVGELGSSNHSVTFTVPSGFGAGRQVAVIVAGEASNVLLFDYETPVITQVHIQQSQLNAGLTELSIFGTGFCLNRDVEACGEVRISGLPVSHPGSRAQDVRGWSDGSAVVDFSGLAGTAQIVVAPGTPHEVVSNVWPFRYFSPSVSALTVEQLTSRRFNTAGGERIKLSGQYFGNFSVNVTVGGNQCTDVEIVTTDVENDKQDLYCDLPPGVGEVNPVVIFRGGASSQNNFLNFNLKYMYPTISNVYHGDLSGSSSGSGGSGGARRLPYVEAAHGSPVVRSALPGGGLQYSMPTVGGVVTIVGDNFGAGSEGSALDVFFGFRIPEVLFQNHTHCVVEVPPTDGPGFPFSVRVGLQSSSRPGDVPLMVGYLEPTVDEIDPPTGRTIGGETITLRGSNFGISEPTITLGGLACAVESFSPSANHDTLTCVTPPNHGVGKQVEVTVNGQTSDAVAVPFDYLAPVVGSIWPLAAPTTGGANITIVGDNFGLSGAVSLVGVRELAMDTVPPTPAIAGVIPIPEEAIISYNHTHVVFVLPEGWGVDYVPVVTVDGRESTTLPGFVPFQYDAPAMESMTPTHGPTAGGYDVIIRGTSFGPAAVLSTRIYIGGKACNLIPVIGDDGTVLVDVELFPVHTHTLLRCSMPRGWGKHLDVVVYIGGRRSTNTLSFSYDPPKIDFLRPNVPDAVGGERVSIIGSNFGFEPTPMMLDVHGLDCATTEWRTDSLIICEIVEDVSGFKNVTLTVANQTSNLYAVDGRLRYECQADFWGLDGEYCLPCPEGGVCEGRGAELYSDSGFWMALVATPSTDCEGGDRRQHREKCPFLQPCEPPESCLGNNTCARGYTADRCSECVKGKYYRLGGECVKCPNNPWIVLVAFVAGAIGLAIGGYVLSRKSVHLAFLSIGVDYFQVLAMFRRSRVAWPPLIKDIFHYMSAFNLNLDISAPECAIPEVSYKQKWLFIQALPIAAGLLFLLAHVSLFVYKKCIICRSRDTAAHGGLLINTFLVMFYFLYLYLARTTLDIFNCQPTTPPDGHTYMLEIFERCWVKGGTQMTLLPFAFGTLLVYVIGFPTFVAQLLFRNKATVIKDQLLRAMGKGLKPVANKDTFFFRRKYHKTYYHFKPDYFFWILVIISRKFLIAFTSLMFRKTPAFQLAMALLVIFAAFVLQVRHLPYMSYSDYSKQTEHFKKHPKALNDPLYARLGEMVEMEEAADRDASAKVSRSMARADAARSAHQLAMTSRTAMFFWNYNTVETVLLGCAVLVTLSGIMFESGRFETNDFDTQKDIITWFVLTIIFFSIVYFFTVFLSEIIITINPTCCAADAKTVKKLKEKKRMQFQHRLGAAAVTAVSTIPVKAGDADASDAPNAGAGASATSPVGGSTTNPMLARTMAGRSRALTPRSVGGRRRSKISRSGSRRSSTDLGASGPVATANPLVAAVESAPAPPGTAE